MPLDDSDSFNAKQETLLLSRRQSVATATDVFTRKLYTTLEELHQIWDETGLSDEMRGQRVITFYKHLNDLVEDIEVYERIDKHRNEMNDLCHQLHLPSDSPNCDQVELIEKLDMLRKEAKRLNKIKSDRLEQKDELKVREEWLCRQLNCSTFTFQQDVPSTEQLRELTDHVSQLETLLQLRTDEVREAKTELLRLGHRMALPIASDQLLSTDSIFSFDYMQNIRHLLIQTREKYDQYVAEFRNRFNRVKTDLLSWRHKCLLVDEPLAMPPFDQDSISEDLINVYKREIERLQTYFNDRQDVLIKVDEWKTLWAEKIEHDKRESDPNRYKNRRGNLQKELNRRRQVERLLLPKARTAVTEATHRWNGAYPEMALLIRNMDPTRYIDFIVSEYLQSKELEKEHKVEERKRQVMMESQFGVAVSPQVSPFKQPHAKKALKQQRYTPMRKPAMSPSSIQNKQRGGVCRQQQLSAKTNANQAAAKTPSNEQQDDIMESLGSYAKFQENIHGQGLGADNANPAHSSFVSVNFMSLSPHKQKKRDAID